MQILDFVSLAVARNPKKRVAIFFSFRNICNRIQSAILSFDFLLLR
ncbi:hypothetical protein [Helicobacter sp. MIT 05-5294]|nr:hypothetical protein [Helicobacter sp. MIT 05-5294]